MKLKKTASNLLERYMENLLKLLKALSQNDCWGSHTHTIMQSINYFFLKTSLVMRQPRLIEPYNKYEFFPTKYNAACVQLLLQLSVDKTGHICTSTQFK